jgi:hypothetical protein
MPPWVVYKGMQQSQSGACHDCTVQPLVEKSRWCRAQCGSSRRAPCEREGREREREREEHKGRCYYWGGRCRPWPLTLPPGTRWRCLGWEACRCLVWGFGVHGPPQSPPTTSTDKYSCCLSVPPLPLFTPHSNSIPTRVPVVPLAIFSQRYSTRIPYPPPNTPPNPPKQLLTVKMRYSFTIAALAAVGAAVPQYSVQPISQISDGQIQAPPATSVDVPVVPSGPAVSTPVAPGVTVTAVVPSGPGETATVIVPSYGASTPVASTGAPAVPISSAPAVPSEVPSAPATVPVVVPSAPAGNASVPVVSSTGGAVYPNSTISVTTGAPSATSGGAGSSPSAPAASGAAAANMASFGGLLLAVAGFVLA